LLSPAHQADHRRSERLVRKSAVAFVRWTSSLGMDHGRIAGLLGLSSRTLGTWLRAWRRGRLPLHSLGGPRRFTTPHQRALAVELLDHVGPGMGLPGLRQAFPHITRSELVEIRGGVREQRLLENTREYQVLQWTHPGTVWAVDYTQPPVPVEERFKQVLAGRDLAGGFQLIALPVVAATAAVVVVALDALFRLFGPPLVLKADNGGQFMSQLVRDLLDRWGVTLLPSPPLTPRYNGSIEAGIGSLKTHAHHRAIYSGRGSVWTADDLEAARMDANFNSRPWGESGDSPQNRWNSRLPITAARRAEFIHTVESGSEQARIDMGLPRTGSLDHGAQAAVGRAAVRRALETLGYLLVTRRRFSPPFNI
jgi:hypothetical protein